MKSTGHDYQGRSVAPGSLSVWVHHLRGPLALHASFRPRGCAAAIGHAAATAGAGSQLAAVYAELARVGRTVVGGNGKTVSLGGYLTGGGHSVLAPRHGLAADQVYEVEVVTPAGDVVVANECQNQDLFWAMRGVSSAAAPAPFRFFFLLLLLFSSFLLLHSFRYHDLSGFSRLSARFFSFLRSNIEGVLSG